ncbi:DUF732 domain-containing protein [Mycobacterium sp. 050134]|uniref:DUF732 domain-containing protein n=1 Tax=Mycobacterium sp. 050134 TaxID=3096111 RepID=UPI002ED8F35B
MKRRTLTTSIAAAAAAIALAGPAHAAPIGPNDWDAPFKDTVNGFGIYGPQDQLAWLGKITCERVGRGVDSDPYKSATFIQRNLERGTTQGQAFQFLGAALDHYCPDQVGFIQRAGH